MDHTSVWLATTPSTRYTSLSGNVNVDVAVVGGGKNGKEAHYHGEDGVYHRLSAICPHMKCVLSWNSAERTWDCACHGSRFAADGAVIHGPALTDLESKTLYQAALLAARRQSLF